MSRNKGAAYENEICAVLSGIIGRKITRQLGQTRDSGTDIHVGKLTIECKRRQSIGSVDKWLAQAIAGAPEGNVPSVVARSDGKPSIIALRLDDFIALMVRAALTGTLVWD